jgi:peptidoglycan/LPS O-acetylase OafA/YrhL
VELCECRAVLATAFRWILRVSMPQMHLQFDPAAASLATDMGLLRLFLAISVLAGHLRYGRGIFGFGFLPGGLAVQCFFIISGFYMALVLNEKYNYAGSYWAFVQQRFLRLYPLYFVVAILILAVEAAITFSSAQPVGVYDQWMKSADHLTPLSVCYYVLVNLVILGQDTLWFLQQDITTGQLFFTPTAGPNTVPCAFFVMNGPTWTLAVEMTFYLLAPFLVRHSIAVQATWLLASLAIRSAFYWSMPAKESLLWTFNFFPSVLFLFMAGSLGYQVYHRHGAALEKFSRKHVWIFWLIGGWMLCGSRLPLKEYFFWLFIPIAMAMVPMLFALTRDNHRDRLIGELSYPYYLVHFHVIIIAEFFLHENHNTIFGPLCLVITLSISYFLYHFVETRTEKFREQLFKKDRAARHLPPSPLPSVTEGTS